MHVARKLQPGDPSCEQILEVIGELAAGSETRMQLYHPMFQQEATKNYLNVFTLPRWLLSMNRCIFERQG